MKALLFGICMNLFGICLTLSEVADDTAYYEYSFFGQLVCVIGIIVAVVGLASKDKKTDDGSGM